VKVCYFTGTARDSEVLQLTSMTTFAAVIEQTEVADRDAPSDDEPE